VRTCLTFLLAVLSAACDPRLEPDHTGALALSVSSEISSAAVTKWTVALTGPAAPRSQSGPPGTTLTFSNLTPGDYSVSIDGFEDVDLVQHGATSVTVRAGTTSNAFVSVTEVLAEVTIVATDPAAAEVGPDGGMFNVVRSGGSISTSLSVAVQVGGLASNGRDYQVIASPVAIPAGQRSVMVPVSPVLDADVEGVETVVLTALGSGSYSVSSNPSATVTIADAGSGPIPLSDFSLISAGSFQMGSTNGASDERPVHTVTISRAFYLQKTEVTQAQWQAVMGTNPSYFAACGLQCPVEQVSWDDIQQFLGRLNQATPGVTYRLPTEAEWEYAARAGTTGDYGGSGGLDQMGWYGGNSGSTTHPVRQKQANAWGLYDMHGNVWEWVQDWYSGTYYTVSPPTDPTGPASGQYRVLRGGSWYYVAYYARSASRFFNNPSSRLNLYGFRLARTP
jgi:hypothetical protein